jgi:hypothetical protein
MESRIRINGYSFKYDECAEMYECRGMIMYDDEHDEIPEPALWKATCALATLLTTEKIKAQPSHSEKGWCEVQITKLK